MTVLEQLLRDWAGHSFNMTGGAPPQALLNLARAIDELRDRLDALKETAGNVSDL